MMAQTERRKRIGSALVFAIAIVFLIAMILLSAFLIPVEASAIDYASYSYVEVNDTVVNTFSSATEQVRENYKAADGIVDQALEFCYIFFSGKTNRNYQLTANFKITASNWATKGANIPQGVAINGNNRIVWVTTAFTAHINTAGGLANKNQGTVSALKYYYAGSMKVEHSSGDHLYYGGMFGINSGTIQNCEIEIAGSIDALSDSDDVKTRTGGVIGQNNGSVVNCPKIVSSATLVTLTREDTDVEENPYGQENMIFSGGIIGEQFGLLSNCTIESGASVLAADHVSYYEPDDLSGWIGLNDYAYNDSEYVHPAGVVIGMLSGGGKVQGCTVKATGSAVAYSMSGGSYHGDVTAGFIAMFRDCSGAQVTGNFVTLSTHTTAFYIEDFDLGVSWLLNYAFGKDTYKVHVYSGGFIGRTSGGGMTIANNVCLIDGGNDLIEDGVSFDVEYKARAGLFAADEDASGNIGTNNWLVRKLDQCNTDRVIANDMGTSSNLNHLNIFGDGSIIAVPSTSSTTAISITVKPGKSPFYGMTDDMSKSSPTFNTARTISLSGSTKKVKYLVFIDDNITSGGELTQLANDINLIKSDVWSKLGSTNDDHRAHFSGTSGVTLSWLNVKLGKDILVREGTPVIEEFRGTFDGQNKKIEFAAGSTISHDYEADGDNGNCFSDYYGVPEDDREEPYYSLYYTGLFASNLGIIKDLKIDFGGTISDDRGVAFDLSDGASYIADDINDRTFTYTEFFDNQQATLLAPSALEADKSYAYFFTGNGYNAARGLKNPGYVDVRSVQSLCFVANYYCGVLVGKNSGTVSNVSLNMSKSSYLGVSAANVKIGGLIGYNAGSFSDVTVKIYGKIRGKAKYAADVGGVVGENNSTNDMRNVCAYIGGEITLEHVSTYHKAVYYLFKKVSKETVARTSDDMKDVIAGTPSGFLNFNPAIVVKQLMAQKTEKIFGAMVPDPTTGSMTEEYESTSVTYDTYGYQSVGAIIGYNSGSGAKLINSSGSIGNKGEFNTPTLNCDSKYVQNIGALVGRVKPKKNASTATPVTFQNAWAVMPYEEYSKMAAGEPNRAIVGDFASDSGNTGTHRVYVQETIAIGEANNNTIRFTLEAKEGLVFSGWYLMEGTNRTMQTAGLDGNYFTPLNQNENGNTFVVEVVPLQLFKAQDIAKIASSTNEGRDYINVTFTLGTNITLESTYVPIGTVEHPFCGTFDGSGLKVTLNGVAANSEYAGLFGCLGAQGTVKNIHVAVGTQTGSTKVRYAGAVVAVNNGTVGQDSAAVKVYAEINASLIAEIVGGVVGENRNLVQNVEAIYTGNGSLTPAATDTSKEVIAGGIVGNNEQILETVPIIKNGIADFRIYASKMGISTNNTKFVLGGAVGSNGAGAAVYSVVSCVTGANAFMNGTLGSKGSQNKLRGFIIGRNESSYVDTLWCLFRSLSTSANNLKDPAFGAPVSIYRDKGEGTPDTSKAVLVNGTNYLNANSMIQYGKGSVSVSIVKYISGNETKGGQIRFISEKYSGDSDPEFYDYVADFYTGEIATVLQGNSGSVYAPPVGFIGGDFYACFQKSSLGSQEDYAYVASKIDSDFRLYVRYQITNSFMIDSATATKALGASEEKPFRGSINGNGCTITMDSASSMHAFVGVLGENDGTYYSEIKNLKFVVQAGTYITHSSDNVKYGFLTNINYGTISGLTMNVRGYIRIKNGYAGAIAGKNGGVISSANVVFEYANYLGNDGYGAVLAKYAGGAVGLNEGVIGSASSNSVIVSVQAGGDYGCAVYGSETAGGIVGTNAASGTVISPIVTISGILGGKYVGGIAGSNLGSIESGFSSINKKASYFGNEAFGGVTGENNGVIGDVKENYEALVRTYIYEEPAYGSSVTIIVDGVTSGTRKTKRFGGAVGNNKENGQIFSVLAEVHANAIASEAAGVFAGENAGSISYCNAESANNCNVYAKKAGAVTGINTGEIRTTMVMVKGNVGSKANGENGIVKSDYAGGFAATMTGSVAHSVVSIYGDFYGTTTGLGAGQAHNNAGENAWVQVINSTKNPNCPTADSGFNSIRVMNDTLLQVTLDYKTNLFTFRSVIKNPRGWYSDISDWNDDGKGRITEKNQGLQNSATYTPASTLVDQMVHLSYVDLHISNSQALSNLASLINGHDYYRGVLFTVDNEIQLNSLSVLTPIGNAEHPFDAIFDGGYHKITFASGSAISGMEYAGLFGYTTKTAIVRNFILDISEGVTIGGVNTFEIGALVGRNEGLIENVFVNLSSPLIYNSGRRYAGSCVGYYDSASEETHAFNTCISVLNGRESIIGNGTTGNQFGVNEIAVLGSGLTYITFVEDYSPGTTDPIRVKYYVPDGTVGNSTFKARCAEFFLNFGGWYSDIRTGELVNSYPGFETIYGSITYNSDDKDVSITPAYNARDIKVVLSFIALSIGDENDFIRFAKNINTYGDQGAKFTLLNDITVNFNNSESVGTPDRPFTGLFEGNGHVLNVTGNMIKREYAGVFGYIGNGGVVRNLHINVTGENVKVGDTSTLYAGMGVGLLRGEIKNFVVTLRADTIVFTTQGLPSTGGIVGRAESGYTINNAWLVLAENATVTNPVGIDTYYVENRSVKGEGRSMRQVGVGSLMIFIESDGSKITFDATEIDEDGRDGFYGYIDNTDVVNEVVEPIHDGAAGASLFIWTVKPGDSVSNDMLAIFINKYISSIEDLERTSRNVRLGRNYRGITYELTKDITLNEVGFEPIGGEVVTGAGTSYVNYVERDFIGGFDGKGHTITMPEGLVINARYAGLFGRVGAQARIKNLTVNAKCAIGYDTGENTTRTIYAGVLAAYALGGEYKNNVVILDKKATLYGSVGYGRTFGYLPRNVGNVATNCWAISYNSRMNYELNADEIRYNSAYVSPSNFLDDGNNQGGVNNIMVVAAGQVGVIRQPNDATRYHFTYSGTSYWYDLNTFAGDKAASIGAQNGSFEPDANTKRVGYNVSFLNSEINSIADLKQFAQNVNDGYNFYKLTFTLRSNVTIGENDEFVAIGTAINGVNGTFDGLGHSITLARGADIGGTYAGIFGSVAEDGTIKNLRILLEGSIGHDEYTSAQVEMGAINSLYAGAIAYNKGQVENVVVISNGSKIRTLNGVSGLVIGYDATNLLKNVWGLVDASDLIATVGEASTGDSSVNTMKIVGIGTVNATFKDASTSDYRMRFDSTSDIPVSGWFKSFEKSWQISEAMLAGGVLTSGVHGYLIAPIDLSAVSYEVAVIKTTIENAEELIAVAEDVNIGGYSFETMTFTLGANVEIPAITTGEYLPIGTEKHPFKGTFSGKLGDDYYSIILREGYSVGGVFGYNKGEIKDLRVTVNGTIGEITSSSDHVYGTIAAFNEGVIERCFVEITEKGKVLGYTAGGVVGRNDGEIKDCIVLVNGQIRAESREANTINAGGIAGINYGVIEGTGDYGDWKTIGLLPKANRYVKEAGDFVLREYDLEANVFLYGKISAISNKSGGIANAGGAIGNNYAGSASYLIVYVQNDALVEANAVTENGGRAGGFVGYARSSINHNVAFLFGEALSSGYMGGMIGYLDGVTVMNGWLVTYNRVMQTAGYGAKTINNLNVKGNGTVKASIDTIAKSVMFTNMTDDNGSKLDGWYLASGVQIDAQTGNVGEGGNTFLPKSNVQNKYVMVVFVNTEIRTASDLADMAASVSSGLSGEDIVFTLMNDVTVEAGDLTGTIGTIEYPFNNVFDGKNFTLTMKGGSIAGEEYFGLFGYIGNAGVIKDLNYVLEEGTYGSENAGYVGALASYSQGEMKDFTITLSENAKIVGNVVGAVVGYNLGTVSGATIVIDGEVQAKGNDNTCVAGGVIGINNGYFADSSIALGETSSLSSSGAASGYSGGIAGENYKGVDRISVAFEGKISVSASLSAYAGVGVGLNLGYLDNAYIEVIGGTLEGGVSGGFAGNNVNAVTDSLIKIVGCSLGGTDSAIGANLVLEDTKVNNVWVYTDAIESVSACALVNSMTYEEGLVLTCPSKQDVLDGKIAFTTDVASMTDAFATFAEIRNGVCAAGSGAHLKNISYAGTVMTYKTFDIVSVTPESRRIAGVKAMLSARKTIGSGAELYAFSQAVNGGAYTFGTATFTLVADFDLPANTFLPDGLFEAIGSSSALPASVTIEGNHHVVTVGDTTLTCGLFGTTNATIRNIGLRLSKTETDAYLAANNGGSIQNAVVYLENGAVVSGGLFMKEGAGTATNLWVVTRVDYALDQGSVSYSVVRINGVGSVVQSGETDMILSAVAEGDMIFIGWTKAGAIISAELPMNTASCEKAIYTAEFISTFIDTTYKFTVLSDVILLGYDGTDETFTLGANITVPAPLTGFKTNVFKGTFEGNGCSLIFGAGFTGSVLGKFAGKMQNVRVDLSAIADGVTIFEGDQRVTLKNVVFVENRSVLSMGAPIDATNVYFETSNASLYEAFKTTSVYKDNYSVIYGNGVENVRYEFGDTIHAEAVSTETQVFAGWFGEQGEVADQVISTKEIALSKEKGNCYMLNYVNRVLSSEDDLIRLATAVAGAFEFEGETFLVTDGGFTVSSSIATIGSADHPFKGSIVGGANSVIYFSADYNTFIYSLHGELKDIVFEFATGVNLLDGGALVRINKGLMSAIIVLSSTNTLAFKNGAALCRTNGGEIKNCWFVTGGNETSVTEGSLVGVNEIRVDQNTIIDASYQKTNIGTKVSFEFIPLVGSFVCLYDYEGKVVFPGAYNYATGFYTAPESASGAKISVKSISSVCLEDELVYLGYLTAEGGLANGSVISLSNDLVVRRNLPTIYFDGITLDLAGHSLSMNAMGEGSLFTARTQGGTFKNGVVYLQKGHVALAAAGATMKNVVLSLADSGMAIPSYRSDNAIVMTFDKAYKTSIPVTSGTYSFVYYEKGAAITPSYDGETPVFTGSDNEEFYFAAIVSLSAKEKEAVYAPARVASEIDFNKLARATEVSSTKLSGRTVTITESFDANGTTVFPLLGFKGALSGPGTITITGGTFNEGFITLGEGGSVEKIALAFKSATIGANAFQGTNVTLCTVVTYQTGSAKHEETVASYMNVYGDGAIEVSFGEGIVYTAVAKGNYALRSWKDKNGTVVNQDTSGNAKSSYALAEPASAVFALRYLVSVNFTGVTEDDLKNGAANMPEFTGLGVYFADELEASGTKINVNVKDIGSGYMFWGLTATTAYETATRNASDAWKYQINWTVGHYNIVLNAELTYVPMEWVSETYTGAAITVSTAALTAITTRANGLGYNVISNYSALGATPPLVDGKPFHAGSYLVNYKIYSGSKMLCNATSGLEINPAILTFKSLAIKDKVYDGTVDAELLPGSMQIQGFKGGDAAYVSVNGVKFAFKDANAEQGKVVVVSGKAKLVSTDPNGEHRYVYLDYAFDGNEITSVQEGLIRANISRATLELEVASIETDYLSQFSSPVAFVPTVKSGLLTKDRANYEAVASKILTRENANVYDAGAYRIIVGDSLALKNYNVVMTGQEAYYIVHPTEIKIFFDLDEIEYGDTDYKPKYHVCDGTMCGSACSHKGMKEGEELYFDAITYNAGGALLPSETVRYDLACLFSDRNKNYSVVSGDGYALVDGVKKAVLKAEGVLKVKPKKLTVYADAERNVKSVGKRNEIIYASLTQGKSFVEKTHTLVVSREAGERVGRYPLVYKVLDGETDVTARYDITSEIDGGNFYEIKKVAIRLKPNKTSVIYGTVVSTIKYTPIVGDGSISMDDLYFAMFGQEKKGATLSDVGVNALVGYDESTILNVGEYDAVFSAELATQAAVDCISGVTMQSGQRMIIVTKKYLTITISDFTKTYNGVSDFRESLVSFTSSGLLDKDKDAVKIVAEKYNVQNAISVGNYKINGTFVLKPTKPEYAPIANNYFIVVIPGDFTINPTSVTIKAEVGYFDSQGVFTPASIMRTDLEALNTIYYGDNKAILKFSIEKGASFLKIPAGSSDKEASDFIASELKISYYRLSRLVPAAGKKTVDELGLIAANNNVKATFNANVAVAPVSIIIKLMPTTKTIGEADPGISYVLSAEDPYDDYAEIPDYFDIAEGTFDIYVTGERTEGESLGSYEYSNIKIDIVNAYSGESLFDKSSATGAAFAGNISKEGISDAKLIIQQKSFLKTTAGKILVYGGSVAAMAALTIFIIVALNKASKRRAFKPKKPKKPKTPKKKKEKAPEGENPEGEAATTEGETTSPEGETAPEGETPAVENPNAEGAEGAQTEGAAEGQEPATAEPAEGEAAETVGESAAETVAAEGASEAEGTSVISEDAITDEAPSAETPAEEKPLSEKEKKKLEKEEKKRAKEEKKAGKKFVASSESVKAPSEDLLADEAPSAENAEESLSEDKTSEGDKNDAQV